MIRNYKLIVATVILLASVSLEAIAATTVRVSLWGEAVEMPTNLGIGMDGNMSKAKMGIASAPNSVKAGEVTFVVKNNSKKTIHEMLVIPIKSKTAKLPFIAAENRINEDAAKKLGEVSELDPGKSGSLTLNLKSGKYALICNVPGHYGAGMWTILTVNP